MSKIYLIAGLGADTRVYNKIDLEGYDVIPISWIDPVKEDTLVSYAQRIIYQYNITPNSIIIGDSLGGIMAVEMAKFIPVKKVILISSIKTSDEAPWYFGLFKTIPVYKLIPGKWFTALGFIFKPFFGRMSDEDGWLFNDMLKNTSPVFIKWAMYAVLQWRNDVIPPNLYHIMGDKDLIFSYKRIKNATIIKGGTHIMIFDKAKQINKLLKGILKK